MNYTNKYYVSKKDDLFVVDNKVITRNSYLKEIKKLIKERKIISFNDDYIYYYYDVLKKGSRLTRYYITKHDIGYDRKDLSIIKCLDKIKKE